jgi:predicted nucleic acid-binding protein
MAQIPLVADTNVLLDLFVFRDPRVAVLRQQIDDCSLQIIYCQAMREEFTDVIARDTFGLSQAEQDAVLSAWEGLAQAHVLLQSAPVRCIDPDDQVFIDLAYQAKPCILISKDLALVRLKHKLGQFNIEVQTY